MIGERAANEPSPYGIKGNAIVQYAARRYDNIVLVGGFSKSYSSLLAFLALPTWLKNHLKVAAPPYLYSGPAPTASLATVLAGLDVNDKRGDAIRADLYRKSMKVLDHVRGLGVYTPNTGNTPIIELPLAAGEDIDAVGKLLWDARHLRDAGRLPAGAARPGRLPRAGHRGQHRRGDRRAQRRHHRAGRGRQAA